MAKKRSKIRVYLIVLLALVAAVYLGILLKQNSLSRLAAAEPWNLTQRFDTLSKLHTNLCAIQTYIYTFDNSSFLQGSCCSPMNFSSYVEQVNGLRNYSGIKLIPPDPYNVSVSLAKQLLVYDQNATLTQQQQAIYNQAVNMSADNGPCCCRCWRWYVFEGLGKYLITKYGYAAKQVAGVWELEDGCGGPLGAPGFNPRA